MPEDVANETTDGVKTKKGCGGLITNPTLLAIVGILALVLAVLALIGAFVVPEVRDYLGLEPTATPTATPQPTVAPTVTPPPGQLAEGVWLCPEDTEGAAYVGHVESKKFHELWCRYGLKISPKNRVCFIDRAAAIREGYEPGGYCEP